MHEDVRGADKLIPLSLKFGDAANKEWITYFFLPEFWHNWEVTSGNI